MQRPKESLGRELMSTEGRAEAWMFGLTGDLALKAGQHKNEHKPKNCSPSPP